jgi:hypothetical protein
VETSVISSIFPVGALEVNDEIEIAIDGIFNGVSDEKNVRVAFGATSFCRHPSGIHGRLVHSRNP